MLIQFCILGFLGMSESFVENDIIKLKPENFHRNDLIKKMIANGLESHTDHRLLCVLLNILQTAPADQVKDTFAHSCVLPMLPGLLLFFPLQT